MSFTRTHKTAQQLALRARIILFCAIGTSDMTVSQKLDTTRETVGRWRKHIIENRLDGLHDEQRPGAPRTISDDKVDEVVRLTLEETPAESTHWSIRFMAKRVGLFGRASRRLVRQRLRGFVEFVEQRPVDRTLGCEGLQ